MSLSPNGASQDAREPRPPLVATQQKNTPHSRGI